MSSTTTAFGTLRDGPWKNSARLTDGHRELFLRKLRFVEQSTGPDALARAVSDAEQSSAKGSGVCTT